MFLSSLSHQMASWVPFIAPKWRTSRWDRAPLFLCGHRTHQCHTATHRAVTLQRLVFELAVTGWAPPPLGRCPEAIFPTLGKKGAVHRHPYGGDQGVAHHHVRCHFLSCSLLLLRLAFFVFMSWTSCFPSMLSTLPLLSSIEC